MDGYARNRQIHQGFSIEIALDGAAVALTTARAPRNSLHTIYVQRILVSITSHVDGKTFDVQDDNSSVKLIARFLDDAEGDATAMADERLFDFGADGIGCTQGKNLQYLANTGGTGFVGKAVIIGYEKLTGVGAPA